MDKEEFTSRMKKLIDSRGKKNHELIAVYMQEVSTEMYPKAVRLVNSLPEATQEALNGLSVEELYCFLEHLDNVCNERKQSEAHGSRQ